jgi:hypothetical protein
MSTADDVAYHTKRAAAADAAMAAWNALPPHKRDNNGRLDISQVSVKAAMEIARLRGPLAS